MDYLKSNEQAMVDGASTGVLILSSMYGIKSVFGSQMTNNAKAISLIASSTVSELVYKYMKSKGWYINVGK